MATKKTPTAVKTVSDKLSKVNENITVYMYDNGYMLEVSGRDQDNEYKTAKIMCNTLDELLALVKESAEMDRDS